MTDSIRAIVSRYMGRGVTDWVMTPREMEAMIGELEQIEVERDALQDEVNRWRLRAADEAGLI